MGSIRALLSSFAPAVVAVGLAAMPQVASASDGGLPGGSWRQTCQNAYVRDGVLYAECRQEDGRYRSASAQITSCQAFGNRDGQLYCESRGDGRYGGNQWHGSFRDSCREIAVDSYGKLSAKCRKDNGSYKRTKLLPENCPSHRAGNHNGNLFCESNDERGGNDRNQWDGSFRNSCRDISIESDGDLLATCQTANGGWRQTRLSARDCASYRAGNRDGNLVCETRDERGGNDRNQWDGSFRNSCRDISIESDGDLLATCQTANGGWRQTRLSARDCASYRAGNRDGNLVCEARDERGGTDRNQWSGSFRNSCREILIESDGDLVATCQSANGGWRQTRLSPRDCASYRAGNRDGNLVCER